jgi:16S rRNA (cytidine1402-2'-O)-methyltransferase
MLDAAIDALAPATRLAIGCGLTLAEGWAATRTVADWRAARVALPDRVPAVFSLLG